MNKRGQLGGIVMIFITVIVGIVLAVAIFNGQAELTTKNVVVNESISVADAKINGNDFNTSVNLTILNVPNAWKAIDCPIESITLTNDSGHELTATTDFTISTSEGIFAIVNNTDTTEDFDTNNNSLIDYTFCLDGYNKDASSRSMAGLIGLLTIIALLVGINWKFDIL